MATVAGRMTVEEFEKLPDQHGAFEYELRNGELIEVRRPKPRHLVIQSRLRDLLKGAVPEGSFVEYEVPFRAHWQFDLRVADVAFISAERWASQDLDQFFQGVPDLVAEVLSPSTSIAEMYERERLCLENGAQQFWVIDSSLRQIKVSTPDGITRTYRPGQTIALPISGEPTLSVDTILGNPQSA